MPAATPTTAPSAGEAGDERPGGAGHTELVPLAPVGGGPSQLPAHREGEQPEHGHGDGRSQHQQPDDGGADGTLHPEQLRLGLLGDGEVGGRLVDPGVLEIQRVHELPVQEVRAARRNSCERRFDGGGPTGE